MSYNNLIGEKGGGGSFKTKPDTLRSNDSFEMLLGLGSGRWKGLKNGLQSLEVNNVPLENSDGTTNFQDFAVFFADGDPAQTQLVNFKLGGGGGTSQVGVNVGNSNASGPGPWVTAAVTTPNADYVDLRFVVSALYYQDSKGVRENTMTLELEMRPTGSANWINPLVNNNAPTYNQAGTNIDSGMGGIIKMLVVKTFYNGNDPTKWNDSSPGYIKITGKTTSPAVKEMRIAVPNTGTYANKTWEVRVRLIEKAINQADPIDERRSIQFESIAAITQKSFGDAEAWRGLVWMQVVGKATDQLSGIPTMRGIFETKIVKTPPSTVYNVTTRQYTGTIWDGSFTLNYTNDPAWCIKDLIEDPISGISALSPGSTLDKWDALEASKYYSQLVPNGKGGTQPRFGLNVRIDQAQNAEEMIQYLAGAVNSLCVDTGEGKWRLKVDKPENPVALFTRDNIVGEFTYQHTDTDSRYNDYTVTFLNAELNYVEDRARVYDQSHIDVFGRKPTTVVALGASTRQEALRRAMFRLRTSINETKMVNFVTNRQGLMLRPLDIILVADTDLGYVGTPTASDNRTTTRLASRSGTTLNLGSSVRLENNVAYIVAFTYPNPNYNPDTASQPTTGDWQKPTLTISRNVTNSNAQRGDVSTIFIDTALPTSVAENAVVALSAANLPSLPRQYRVMDVTPQDEEFVSVSALIVDTGKYTAADNVDETAILGQVSNTTVPPPGLPSDGMFDIRTYDGELQVQRVLAVHWERPASLFLSGFKVEYQINDGSWITHTEVTSDTYVEIVNPMNGRYNWRITSVDRRGRTSLPLRGTITLDETTGSSPPHDFGTLANRPATGIINQRYTTTDQVPNVTYIWTETGWQAESTINRDATEIAYVGGETLEELKPAEGGATNGMNNADLIAFNQLNDDIAAAEALATQIKADVEADLAAFDDDIAAINDSLIELNEEIVGISPGANPNMLDDGGFERGDLLAWSGTGPWAASKDSNWGPLAQITGGATGTFTLTQTVNNAAPNQAYTLAADIKLIAASGTAYVDMLFYNAAGTLLSDSPQVEVPVGRYFAISDSNRKANKCTVISPAGTSKIICRFVISNGVNITEGGIRRIKLELGDKATAFSSEASAYSSYRTGISNSGTISSLNTQVNTPAGRVQQAIDSATTANGGLATLTTRMSAGNPNLLRNPTFEQGDFSYWTGVAGVNWLVSTSPAPWGVYAYTNTNVADGQDIYLYQDVTGLEIDTYTVTADMGHFQNSGTGVHWLAIQWFNASNQLISHVNGTQRASGVNFDATGESRKALKFTATAPVGMSWARVILYWRKTNGVLASAHVRQVKFERGSVATPYSQEASLKQAFTTMASLNSSVSSLNTEVFTTGGKVGVLQSSMTSALGSVATLKQTAVTGSGNLVKQSDFVTGTGGWGWYSPIGSSYEWGRDGAGAPWRPGGLINGVAQPDTSGEHNLFIHQLDGNQSAWGQIHTEPRIAVTSNKFYEWSVYAAAHRANIGLKIEWYDVNNNFIRDSFASPAGGNGYGNGNGNGQPVGSGGPSIGNWTRRFLIDQAPANASMCVPVFFKDPTYAGQGDSWGWMVRPMFREVPDDYRIGPSAYVASGNRASVESFNTSINGVLAKAGVTLDVNGYMTGWAMNNNGSSGNMVINSDYFSILKPGGGARTEFSGGNWRVYDANGVLRVRMGVW